MAKETISVRLDPETLKRLDAISKSMGRKRGAIMTHAIERYVEAEEWQVNAIQEAMDELGRGEADLVDHEEIAGWLKTWGTQDETGSSL